jgi:hypothetical protein
MSLERCRICCLDIILTRYRYSAEMIRFMLSNGLPIHRRQGTPATLRQVNLDPSGDSKRNNNNNGSNGTRNNNIDEDNDDHDSDDDGDNGTEPHLAQRQALSQQPSAGTSRKGNNSGRVDTSASSSSSPNRTVSQCVADALTLFVFYHRRLPDTVATRFADIEAHAAVASSSLQSQSMSSSASRKRRRADSSLVNDDDNDETSYGSHDIHEESPLPVPMYQLHSHRIWGTLSDFHDCQLRITERIGVGGLE